MYSAGIQAAAVLQLLGKNSHLIDVSIGFQDKLLASSYYTAAQVDPVHLLRFSKDTLKTLTVKNWFLMTRTFTVYPRLRNLTIMGEWVPATPKLRRAFPNLSLLYVYGDPTVSPRHYASRSSRHVFGQQGVCVFKPNLHMTDDDSNSSRLSHTERTFVARVCRSDIAGNDGEIDPRRVEQ